MNLDKIKQVLCWIADHFFFLIRVMVTLGFVKNKETKDSEKGGNLHDR